MNKVALQLILLGILQIILAFVYPHLAIVLVWSGIDWILAAISHTGFGVRIYGKNQLGQIRLSHIILFMPYYLVTWMTWQIQVFLTKEPVYNEIVPQIWLGRRCSNEKELPPDVETVVDLTAEFAEPKSIVQSRKYILLAAPDGGYPDMAAFENVIRQLLPLNNIYIHCALGHGRSATLLAGLLIAKGLAATMDDAEAMIQNKRPAVHINRYQRSFLNNWIQQQKQAA